MNSSIFKIGQILIKNRALNKIKSEKRMTTSIDPNEMPHYELSHLDLHICTSIWFGLPGRKS